LPGDYGFVIGAIAEEGEPLDILCLTSRSSFPGCQMEVMPVGMLDIVGAAHVDHKILAVPANDPRFSVISEVEKVLPHVRREVEHFFTIYWKLKPGSMGVESWHGREVSLFTPNRNREACLYSRQTPGHQP